MIPYFNTPEDLRARFAEQEFQRERLNELLPTLSDRDGLVPISALIVEDDGTLKLRVDSRVQVRPHRRAEKPARWILERPGLWPRAKIRVQSDQSIVGRAPVRGVPFHRAVDIVLREREHKSGFWIPNQERDVLYSTLLTRLRCQNGKNGTRLVLEVWQWIGAGVEVEYGHAILTGDAKQVLHLDGARVLFSCEDDARSLFWTGVKRKGVNYQKFFRVDAELPVDDAVQLLRGFFSIEELVNEYFVHASKWHPNPSA